MKANKYPRLLTITQSLKINKNWNVIVGVVFEYSVILHELLNNFEYVFKAKLTLHNDSLIKEKN